ncbi:MAG: hypothetical protein E6R08_04920 [Nevskiaceae bacterium]|nr:MAG: hypothetical protein E6R08_04920 [Nevskiaceae bacterium]
MGAVDHEVAADDAVHAAWSTLDDALQVLVQAESLVLLLNSARDVEEPHRYGAGMACDLLRTLKAHVETAQRQIRPSTRRV